MSVPTSRLRPNRCNVIFVTITSTRRVPIKAFDMVGWRYEVVRVLFLLLLFKILNGKAAGTIVNSNGGEGPGAG